MVQSAFWATTLNLHKIPLLHTNMMDNKNEPCRFVNGKYIGKTGWIDASCPATKFMVYVIVDLGLKGYKHTRVKKENVA